MTQISKQDFINTYKYFANLPHQVDAVGKLYDQLSSGLKEDTHVWIQTYRSTPAAVKSDNPLNVPYQSQNDNLSGTGYRECFSSSCAMVAMYYGKIENDDAYNLVRQKYGDTTDAQAQVRALRSLGLEANFITNATTQDLKQAINEGRPVPCGWLHLGPANAPSGGGHYSVVIGYTKDAWIVNDPNGEANLVSGGYVNHNNGARQSYSFKNWSPRWIVEGEGSGWMIDIRDPAKK